MKYVKQIVLKRVGYIYSFLYKNASVFKTFKHI